jgi:NAD-dependent dihydropyrimidine dehydrogenase PreA subunit
MLERLSSSWNLARLRFVVQLFTFFLTIWGSTVLGYYTADKISTALPALSCAYDQHNGGYCVLIPLQHQMHHRIGEALVKAQQISQQVLLPTLISLASFALFFFVLGKAFCAWVCPLGTVQEWLNRLGRRLGLQQNAIAPQATARVRPWKWLILLSLVFAVPLAAGMGVAPHSLGNPYCDVCPSRIVTTLLTGNVDEFAVNESGWLKFALGAVANTLFGFVIIAALALRQPFCRICPMLAMNAMLRHVSLTRLVKRQSDKCDKCGICHQACPMDIHEIHTEHGRKAFHEDCTLCGRCAEYCPDDGVISIRFGPWPVFQSSRNYYKQRVKNESPNGDPKPIRIVRQKDSVDLA